MRASDMRNMTIEELRQKETDFRKELFNLKFQRATGEIENPKRMWTVRKNIARVLTLITEKTAEEGEKNG